MPFDLKLDVTSGDITIPSRLVTGEDLVIQKCRIRTETFAGEWRLDSRHGAPYVKWLDEANVPTEQIETYFKAEYEAVEGVRHAVVTAELDDNNVIDIDAEIYIDQDDAPDFRLDAVIRPDQPAVIRAIRIGGIL